MISFSSSSTRDDATFTAVLNQLVAHNAQHGVHDPQDCTVAAHDDGRLVGGLIGRLNYGWLNVWLLWVDTAVRRQGVGTRLMAEAETLAAARLCSGICLDSFDPGAVAFYERLGYERCGQLADFPPGRTRIFLKKHLPKRSVPTFSMRPLSF